MNDDPQPHQGISALVRQAGNLLSELTAVVLLQPLLIVYFHVYLPARGAFTTARIQLYRLRHRPKL